MVDWTASVGAAAPADETAPPNEALAPLLASVFPSGVDTYERVAEGVSTWVYRLARGDETFYLRILPEPDASYAPEVAAHEQARKLGVRAPEVLWYAHRYEPLQRSVMVTAEVAAALAYQRARPARCNAQ